MIHNVTNYASPVIACTALNDGDSLYFPSGVYTLDLSEAQFAWTAVYKLMSPTATNITLYGDGRDTTTVYLPVYALFLLFCAQSMGYGDLTIRDIEFKCKPSNHTVQGPAAISFGEHGPTIHSGRLRNVDIYNCKFTNVAFAVHGCGCESLKIHDNIITTQGGLAYPENFSEVFNLEGAHNNDTTFTNTMNNLEIYNNDITPDSVYGDHVIYTLSEILNVSLHDNTIKMNKNGVYKFFNHILPDSGYTMNNLSINNETFGGCKSEGIFTFSGMGNIGNALITNVTSEVSDYGVFSEWHGDSVDIKGVLFKKCNYSLIYFQKNISLPSLGSLRIKNIFGKGCYSAGFLFSINSFANFTSENLCIENITEGSDIFSISNSSDYLILRTFDLDDKEDDMALDRNNTNWLPVSIGMWIKYLQNPPDNQITVGTWYKIYAWCIIDAYDNIRFLKNNGYPQLVSLYYATSGDFIITVSDTVPN